MLENSPLNYITQPGCGNTEIRLPNILKYANCIPVDLLRFNAHDLV